MTEQDDRKAALRAILDTRWPDGGRVTALSAKTAGMIWDSLAAAGFRRPDPQTKCLDCGRTDGGCDRVVQGDAKLPQNSEPQDDRIVIYANSNVSRGKFAAAAVHAALTAAGVHPGVAVIVLGAKPSDIENRTTVIHDAGRTEVEPGTVTAGTDWRPEPQEPEEWEYGQSEVLQDGSVVFGSPVETLEEAIRRRDIDRINYPWPEELGVGRRRKAGPWEPIGEADDQQ